MEEWKLIPNYPNYSASSSGRIRNNKTNRILIQFFSGGYRRVTLSNKGIQRGFHVHIIICELFVGQKPIGKTLLGRDEYTVNHKDGNYFNNNKDNLEWATHSEQMVHAYSTGLYKIAKGEDHHKANLTNKVVLEIRRLYRQTTISQKDIAKMFSIHPTTVWDIIHGRAWSSVQETS